MRSHPQRLTHLLVIALLSACAGACAGTDEGGGLSASEPDTAASTDASGPEHDSSTTTDAATIGEPETTGDAKTADDADAAGDAATTGDTTATGDTATGDTASDTVATQDTAAAADTQPTSDATGAQDGGATTDAAADTAGPTDAFTGGDAQPGGDVIMDAFVDAGLPTGPCKVGQSGACPPGSFCETPAGTCGTVGKCTAQPISCGSSFLPVCGCDDKTYANACARRKSGVSEKNGGKCPDVMGPGTQGPGEQCEVGLGHCKTGLYCAGSSCTTGDKGMCQSPPASCPDYEDLACGCDDKTYQNGCKLAAAGQNMKAKGKCGGGSSGGGTIPKGGKCDVAKGGCKPDLYCKGGCAGSGTCEPKPKTCGSQFAQVCGCNGQSYANDCSAAFDGVNVKAKGPCALAPGTTCKPKISYCGAKAFCKTKTCADAAGVCANVPKENSCPKVLKYVCTCDNKTMKNECEAWEESRNVKHAGKCK